MCNFSIFRVPLRAASHRQILRHYEESERSQSIVLDEFERLSLVPRLQLFSVPWD
jgi:hypothetical protein